MASQQTKGFGIVLYKHGRQFYKIRFTDAQPPAGGTRDSIRLASLWVEATRGVRAYGRKGHRNQRRRRAQGLTRR